MDLLTLYKNCNLCPRACGVDRLANTETGTFGYCGESSELRLAFAGLHRGEEPPLSGENGSGTVFVTGCNLRCCFCQNWQISGGTGAGKHSGNRKCLGKAVSGDEFAAICLDLQNKGAENINIVTGSHAIPAIVQGLNVARAIGLHIPVLWNSSGYESPAALEILNDHIDIYLPDLKTLDEKLSAEFFNAPDYPQAAMQAILWMIKNAGCRIMVRHLILPGYIESTRSVLRWFADNAMASGVLLSLMSQYTPIKEGGPSDSTVVAASIGPTPRHNCPSTRSPVRVLSSGGSREWGVGSRKREERSGGLEKDVPSRRFLSKREYDTVLGWLDEFGIENGFCQELLNGSDWLPDFTHPNPFSSKLSVPVWSCFR
jgi:putative pyruvate formate lyase activating enzyme